MRNSFGTQKLLLGLVLGLGLGLGKCEYESHMVKMFFFCHILYLSGGNALNCLT